MQTPAASLSHHPGPAGLEPRDIFCKSFLAARCVYCVPTPADICRYLLETREHHLPGEYFHMVLIMTMADATHSSFGHWFSL